jgi:VanZ family protein
MTLLFLISVTAAFFGAMLAAGLKWIQHRTVLWILCTFIFIVTLFFGLKPKGYRFVNQAHWLKQGYGIAFTNTSMIYSEKTLGETGFNDSVTITADINPRLDLHSARFLTIIDPKGEELLSVNQWKNNLFVSLYDAEGKPIAHVYLPNAISADTIQRVAIGIGCGKLWIGSSNVKKVSVKRILNLQPHFLEPGTLLIGYSASGMLPWHGKIHRLELSGRCAVPVATSTHTALSPDDTVPDPLCTQTTVLFKFHEKFGRRISNKCPAKWDLYIPLFPKMFKYEWPQPLTSIFPLSKYSNCRALVDPIINFLGFIPFGAIFYLLFITFRKSAAATLFFTILIAFSTSTGIELIQIFIPTRVSQQIDIVLNVAGATCGALLMLITLWVLRKRQ